MNNSVSGKLYNVQYAETYGREKVAEGRDCDGIVAMVICSLLRQHYY